MPDKSASQAVKNTKSNGFQISVRIDKQLFMSNLHQDVDALLSTVDGRGSLKELNTKLKTHLCSAFLSEFAELPNTVRRDVISYIRMAKSLATICASTTKRKLILKQIIDLIVWFAPNDPLLCEVLRIIDNYLSSNETTQDFIRIIIEVFNVFLRTVGTDSCVDMMDCLLNCWQRFGFITLNISP